MDSWELNNLYSSRLLGWNWNNREIVSAHELLMKAYIFLDYGLSQWTTTLQCIIVSYWLCPCLVWYLIWLYFCCCLKCAREVVSEQISRVGSLVARIWTPASREPILQQTEWPRTVSLIYMEKITWSLPNGPKSWWISKHTFSTDIWELIQYEDVVLAV